MTERAAPRPAEATAIAVEGLHKSYGAVRALDGVSFEIAAGGVFGLLGPNGAGKTTLLEILEGLRQADDGTATVLGAAVPRELPRVRARLGVAMQTTALPPLLTPIELLELYATFYPRPRRPRELIEDVGLAEKATAQTRHLSGGQSQRLALALALVGNPDVLVLDEPTSGLDPQARRSIWELVLGAGSGGKRTVILATHQMEEASLLCDRVAILDHGTIQAIGAPIELIDRYCPGHVIRFETPNDVPLSAVQTLGADVSASSVRAGYQQLTLRAEHLEPALERLMAMRAVGVLAVENLRVDRATLEDVFLTLTGREIRE